MKSLEPVPRSFLWILFLLVSVYSTPAVAQENAELKPITVSNLDARDEAVYFSFGDNRIVSPAEAEAGYWDIRFEGTSIFVNGEAQLVERPFDYITRAPESGYAEDDETAGPAIPAANGAGWYDYDPSTHIVSAIPDRTILVHTLHDTYAKLEVLSYYMDQDETGGVPRHYTFRYFYRADGSRDFR